MVLTPQEVADRLKIAKNTVYDLIKRGDLNAYRVGKKIRVDEQDVEEYKNRSKRPQIIPENNEIIKIKDDIGIQSQITPSSSFIISGQDAMLDILARYLENHPRGIRSFRSYSGCFTALYEMYMGNIPMTAVHLWDVDTGEYNIPFVKRMLPGIPVIIVHLAVRTQGFYVKKGNPKKITAWDDLKRNDITIINREKGSGTRILLDGHLKLLGISSATLPGYKRECTSHLAMASIIARGGADVGLGNEKTSQLVNGIDFIPLQKERYELVIKKEDMKTPHFKTIVEILQSEEFKSELEGLGGYDISETGNIVAEL